MYFKTDDCHSIPKSSVDFGV